MVQEKSGRGDMIGPLDWCGIVPFEPAAASDGRGWAGLEAARFIAAPNSELSQPALTHHMLILFVRPPDEPDSRYEGVKRHVPPPVGSISLIPAGSPAVARTTGCKDQLFVFLEPSLVERVAVEAFDVNPARLTVPPLDALNLPNLRSAMLAIGDELTPAAGGRLAVQSLANVLAVQLIRQVTAPHQPSGGRNGALPKGKLRAIVEYIEEHLDDGLTLQQMAAAAHLSVYHFARQFKAAIGVPPHQYVIARRVGRAQQLLQPDGDLSLAEIALRVGFSDQSQFSHHFKRVVGITPGQFRKSARIAYNSASSSKNPARASCSIQS